MDREIEPKDLIERLEFLKQTDYLKQVKRKNVVIFEKRNENDAEHSWHMSLMALVLKDYFVHEFDLFRSLEMIILHDLVEIRAGDIFCFSDYDQKEKTKREMQAAEWLFSILPESSATELMQLWAEYDKKASPESTYAACIDRFQAFLLNCNTDYHTWRMPGVTKEKLLARMNILEKNMPELWKYSLLKINEYFESCEANEDGMGKGSSANHIIIRNRQLPFSNMEKQAIADIFVDFDVLFEDERSIFDSLGTFICFVFGRDIVQTLVSGLVVSGIYDSIKLLLKMITAKIREKIEKEETLQKASIIIKVYEQQVEMEISLAGLDENIDSVFNDILIALSQMKDLSGELTLNFVAKKSR